MKYLEMKNISFKYDEEYIFKEFSLNLDEGQILLIKGKSGKGKSTILRIIAGLEKINKGEIYLNNKNITNLEIQKRKVGFVFQDFALFPHLTVGENILYGMKTGCLEYWLNLIGLNEYENRYPNTLSIGQKQRVALARTLANNPDLILLDEPFSALDEEIKNSIREDLKKILKQLEITTIIVSHDLNDKLIADKIIEI